MEKEGSAIERCSVVGAVILTYPLVDMNGNRIVLHDVKDLFERFNKRLALASDDPGSGKDADHGIDSAAVRAGILVDQISVHRPGLIQILISQILKCRPCAFRNHVDELSLVVDVFDVGFQDFHFCSSDY